MADGAIELTLNRDVMDKTGSRFTGNRRVTQHTILVVRGSLSQATTDVRAISAAMSNPPLAFAGPAGAGTGAFEPLSEPFPPELALVSLQLLPSGLNVSGIFDALAKQDSAAAGPAHAYPHAGTDSDAATPPAVSTGVLLARVRHIFQSNLDDAALAAAASVDLAKALAPRWSVASVVELTVDVSSAHAFDPLGLLPPPSCRACRWGACPAPSLRARGTDGGWG